MRPSVPGPSLRSPCGESVTRHMSLSTAFNDPVTNGLVVSSLAYVVYFRGKVPLQQQECVDPGTRSPCSALAGETQPQDRWWGVDGTCAFVNSHTDQSGRSLPPHRQWRSVNGAVCRVERHLGLHDELRRLTPVVAHDSPKGGAPAWRSLTVRVVRETEGGRTAVWPNPGVASEKHIVSLRSVAPGST
jgi:hypothetical protein